MITEEIHNWKSVQFVQTQCNDVFQECRHTLLVALKSNSKTPCGCMLRKTIFRKTLSIQPTAKVRVFWL